MKLKEFASTNKLYYRFSHYLRERFNCKVKKINVDAGFSCPNRDGKISSRGCIYCDNRAFAPFLGEGLSLEEQVGRGIERAKRKGFEKFIVYFQTYTNTYAPLQELKEKYGVVRKFKDVVGIAIGTRPDCVDNKVLDLLEEFASQYEVWLEYGLQSIHNQTLNFINRGHTYQDFLRAVELTRKCPEIKICAHVIIGLPGEDKDTMLKTAQEIARLRLEGIKIHPLHIIKGTQMENLYLEGKYRPLTLQEYINIVVDFLEYLWPQTVIQRISADCPSKFLVAPLWILDKAKVLSCIEDSLKRQAKFQGRLYGG